MCALTTVRDGSLCGGCAQASPPYSQPHNLTTYIEERGKREQRQQEKHCGDAYCKHRKQVVKVVRSCGASISAPAACCCLTRRVKKRQKQSTGVRADLGITPAQTTRPRGRAGRGRRSVQPGNSVAMNIAQKKTRVPFEGHGRGGGIGSASLDISVIVKTYFYYYIHP